MLTLIEVSVSSCARVKENWTKNGIKVHKRIRINFNMLMKYGFLLYIFEYWVRILTLPSPDGTIPSTGQAKLPLEEDQMHSCGLNLQGLLAVLFSFLIWSLRIAVETMALFFTLLDVSYCQSNSIIPPVFLVYKIADSYIMASTTS